MSKRKTVSTTASDVTEVSTGPTSVSSGAEMFPVLSIPDNSPVEEAGMAFDPARQHLELTRDQKLRTTALMMAIHAYEKIIIKDADYYEAVVRHRQLNGEPPIKAATMDAMVEAAIKFELFIVGEFSRALPIEDVDSDSLPQREAVPETETVP
jgi:hypothetical protein